MVYCVRATNRVGGSPAHGQGVSLLLVSKRREATRFGRYLRALMDAKGYSSDAELSRATGVDSSMISKWWSGTQPNIHSLRKLAPHLGVRVGDLIVNAELATPEELGMVGEPPPPPPPAPRDPLIRKVAAALADDSIPSDERDRLRRGMQHALDLWLEWRHRPVEPQTQPQ